jgi:alkanesulfonate monooxygenase SsuD/methylene tetrahydromethanopterin reductase-like flavin-dependent oxidoreductase (luciferase family)
LRDGRVDFDGTYYRVEDCVLDPPARPPLMLGSTGPRMLRIGLPHVDAWNVWWSDYGNTPEGFATVRDRVEEAAAEAGRAPGEVAATAAVLVKLAGGGGRLMGSSGYNSPVRPVQGSPEDIAEHLTAMAAAGASHLQLVLDPITESSIDTLGETLALLDR